MTFFGLFLGQALSLKSPSSALGFMMFDHLQFRFYKWERGGGRKLCLVYRDKQIFSDLPFCEIMVT